MAKQRYIQTKFWDDSYIITLTPNQKFLFLYFLTCPLTNISGVYEISMERIAFDTKLPEVTIRAILRKLEQDKKITYRDGWLVIHNFIKNQALNPKVIEGIKLNLANAPVFAKNLVKIDSLYIDYGSLSHSNSNLKSNPNSNALAEINKQKKQIGKPMP